CATGGYESGRTSRPTRTTSATVTARDIVTGRATASSGSGGGGGGPSSGGGSGGGGGGFASPDRNKCFPFFVNDGTGRIDLVGFGSNVDDRKIELRGVVRTYDSAGEIVPFLKVEGRSDQRGGSPQTEVMPVFSQRQSKNMEECFRNVRKYAIRLTHNEEVQNAFKKNRDLWNYIDINHQDTVSKLAGVCEEEPEIVTDYLSRAVQNEISKNMNYGFEGGRESFERGIPSDACCPDFMSYCSAGQTPCCPADKVNCPPDVRVCGPNEKACCPNNMRKCGSGGPQGGAQPSNVVPIIVVMRDVSNTQLDELRKASGISFNGPMPIEPLDKLTIVRMPASKDNIDTIRSLPFVEDVKVDSVNLIVYKDVNKAFESKRLEKFEIPRDDILKKLEVIKSLAGEDDDQVSLSESQDSILQASNSLDEFENETSKRGLGYTLSWVLGAAAEQERKDAQFLNDQITQLENTIKTLDAVASSTDDITIKASLKEQVDILKMQADGLKKEAENKKKNAGGILALIRNLFGG
ncbi:MAG: hypothetical protein HY051_06110, partial [Candidatus Aenigmarchaeota archaeon]|nr:hypothetical protein [Candidatus Aenigmarchaeota archaeon]